MPRPSPAFCLAPGCSALTSSAYCRAHAAAKEHARPNFDIRRWYRTPRWRAMRSRVKSEQAYRCAICKRVELKALDIDHIRKHDGDPDRFWDRGNLQAICKPCHTRKTRGE